MRSEGNLLLIKTLKTILNVFFNIFLYLYIIIYYNNYIGLIPT